MRPVSVAQLAIGDRAPVVGADDPRLVRIATRRRGDPMAQELRTCVELHGTIVADVGRNAHSLTRVTIVPTLDWMHDSGYAYKMAPARRKCACRSGSWDALPAA